MKFLKKAVGYSLLLFGTFFGVFIMIPVGAIAFVTMVICIQSLDKGADLTI